MHCRLVSMFFLAVPGVHTMIAGTNMTNTFAPSVGFVRSTASFVVVTAPQGIISMLWRKTRFTYAGTNVMLNCKVMTNEYPRNTHPCPNQCDGPGICQIDPVPKEAQSTFDGHHERFDFTKVSTKNCKSKHHLIISKANTRGASSQLCYPHPGSPVGPCGKARP
jgi:hypothetical protein